jgi:FtsH-binding integral membrane protein
MMYAGFIGTMSFSMIPLIHMYSMPVIYDALIASTACVGSLGAVAYYSPSQQFLSWGGPLALGCGGLLGLSMLQIMYPHSRALSNVVLYGGLGIFSMFMLYHTQRMMDNAKTNGKYDPINNSIGIYIAAVNIFTSLT